MLLPVVLTTWQNVIGLYRQESGGRVEQFLILAIRNITWFILRWSSTSCLIHHPEKTSEQSPVRIFSLCILLYLLYIGSLISASVLQRKEIPFCQTSHQPSMLLHINLVLCYCPKTTQAKSKHSSFTKIACLFCFPL